MSGTKKKKWMGIKTAVLVGIIFLTGIAGCKRTITGPKPPEDNGIDYPFNVSNDDLNSYNPKIGIDSRGRIYIIWQDAVGLKMRIRYEDGRWGDVETIRDSVFGYGIAVDIYDNAHIVWGKTQYDSIGATGYTAEYMEIYRDGTRSEIIELSDTQDVDQPVIAADSMGGVHVMWWSGHGWLYKYKSFDGTWEWMDTLGTLMANPRLYSKPDGSLIMILSPGYMVSYYEHPRGGRWSREEIVDTSGIGVNSWCGYYGYDRERDRGYVFWTEQTYACGSNSGEIFYRYKENGVWSGVYKVEGTCGWPRTKKIFIKDGDIEVIYDDGRHQYLYDIYKSHKSEEWEVDTFIRLWGSFVVDCVMDREDVIHCVWSVRDEEGQYDIYYGEKKFGKIIRR